MIRKAVSLSILFLYICYEITQSLDCTNVGSCTGTCTTSTATTGCSCNVGSDVDLYFMISLQQNIGDASNFAAEINWLKLIAGGALQGDSGFGYSTLGGSNAGQDVTSYNIYDVGDDYAQVESNLDDLKDDYDGTQLSDYMLQGIQNMMTEMDTRNSARQKIVLIIANSNPSVLRGQSNLFSDICSEAYNMKQKNIRAYVVAIGTDTIDWNHQYFDCIMEDPDNDFITVSNISRLSDATTQVLDKLCVDAYQFKITEVKANYISDGPPRFVEAYNFGVDIDAADLALTFQGLSAYSPSTTTIPQGEYFVFYDSGDGSYGCPGSYCFAVTFTDNANEDWTATITADLSGSDGATTDTITQDTNDFWLVAYDDFTYELRGIGYYNRYGTNWRQSCNINGTMGSVSASLVCVPADGTCVDAMCTQNGDSASCDSDAAYCSCTDGDYFPDGSTCRDIPLPSNCVGWLQKDAALQDEVIKLVWDRAPYDGDLQYSISYWSNQVPAYSTDNGLGPMNAFVADDPDNDRTIVVATWGTVDVIIGPQDLENTGVSNIQCPVGTFDPTPEPTTEPTGSPTPSPSIDPTPAPTFDTAAIFIDGLGNFCTDPRCECYDEPKSCCDENDDGDTDNDCTIHSKVLSLATTDNEFSVNVRVFPDDYPFNSTVCYAFREIATVNKSVDDEDEDTDDDTQRRLRRMLLQNNITTTMYNMTTTQMNINTTFQEHENEIKITFEPRRGCIKLSSSSTPLSGTIDFTLTQGLLTCEKGNEECFATCDELAVEYELELLNCTTYNYITGVDICELIYPTTLTFYAQREDCSKIYPVAKPDNSIPDWLWWVLIALIIFLIILAWLIYRYWWKQRKGAGELGDAEDELDQQNADNLQGFGADLDNGDVEFNPMATGVPGMNRPADVYSNEIDARQLESQNVMADVQAEVFKHRQDYGQVHGTGRQNM